jgi:hypothetical protein
MRSEIASLLLPVGNFLLFTGNILSRQPQAYGCIVKMAARFSMVVNIWHFMDLSGRLQRRFPLCVITACPKNSDLQCRLRQHDALREFLNFDTALN